LRGQGRNERPGAGATGAVKEFLEPRFHQHLSEFECAEKRRRGRGTTVLSDQVQAKIDFNGARLSL
jgi:hypothetical protein